MDRYVERKGFHESLQKVTGSCTSDPFTGTDSLNKIQIYLTIQLRGGRPWVGLSLYLVGGQIHAVESIPVAQIDYGGRRRYLDSSKVYSTRLQDLQLTTPIGVCFLLIKDEYTQHSTTRRVHPT